MRGEYGWGYTLFEFDSGNYDEALPLWGYEELIHQRHRIHQLDPRLLATTDEKIEASRMEEKNCLSDRGTRRAGWQQRLCTYPALWQMSQCKKRYAYAARCCSFVVN